MHVMFHHTVMTRLCARRTPILSNSFPIVDDADTESVSGFSVTTSVSANALAPSSGGVSNVSATSLSVPTAVTPTKPRRKQSTKQKVMSHTDDDDIYTMKVRQSDRPSNT